MADETSRTNRAKGLAKDLAAKQTKKYIIRTTLAVLAPVWIPILIIFLVMFFVFIVVLIPFMQPQPPQNITLISPSPSIASPSAGVSQEPTPIRRENPPCSFVDQRLKSEFNISMTGTGCENRQLAYGVYASLFSSVKFKQLVNNAGSINIRFDPSRACGGRASGSNFVIGRCSSTSSLRYLFIHEMGHVIRNRNSSIRYGFPLSSLVNTDRNCYEQGFLKSYALRSGIRVSESFSEATALYVLNRKGSTYSPSNGFYGRSFTNFKQECPNTYRQIRDNVFGGYEFN